MLRSIVSVEDLATSAWHPSELTWIYWWGMSKSLSVRWTARLGGDRGRACNSTLHIIHTTHLLKGTVSPLTRFDWPKSGWVGLGEGKYFFNPFYFLIIFETKVTPTELHPLYVVNKRACVYLSGTAQLCIPKIGLWIGVLLSAILNVLHGWLMCASFPQFPSSYWLCTLIKFSKPAGVYVVWFFFSYLSNLLWIPFWLFNSFFLIG